METIFASGRRINDTLLKFLCFGYFPDKTLGKTLFEAFRDTVDLDRYRRNHPSDPAHIADLLQDRMSATLQGVKNRKLGMGLSAGLDSRAIFYELHRRDVPVRLYTFGTPGTADSDFASVLAGQVGHAIEVVRTDSMTLDVPRMLKGAQELQDFIPSPRLMLIEQMQAREEIELHGFLNDTMTGNTSFPVETDWEGVRMRAARRDDAFGFQRYFPGYAEQHLPAEPFCDESILSYWDQTQLFFRQMQRFRIPDPHGQRLFPFETGDWVGFWYSRDRVQRLGQRLYLAFLRSLNSPIFFDIDQSGVESRHDLNDWQSGFLYGTEDRRGIFPEHYAASGPPPGSDGHFCATTCFHQNSSFREASLDLVARLEARGLLRQDFIAAVMEGVRLRRKSANKQLKGLMSLELALAAELISLD